jgi:hypothetical protein
VAFLIYIFVSLLFNFRFFNHNNVLLCNIMNARLNCIVYIEINRPFIVNDVSDHLVKEKPCPTLLSRFVNEKKETSFKRNEVT